MVYPATWLVLLMIGILILICGGLVLWGWHTGQFEDIESAKYRMMEERDRSDDRPTG